MRWITAAGMTLLGLTACAGGDAGSGGETMATAPTAPAEVHVTAHDFAFEAPDTVASGWTTLVLHNNGPNLHHVMVLQLTDGKTLDDLEAAIGEMQPGEMMPPAWAVPLGGPNPPDAGADTRATVHLEPGAYALVCIVDTPDHVPHMMKGMVKALTVVPTSDPAAPEPTADMTVTMVDFSFAPGSDFSAGQHVLKFVNDGMQPHEFELVRLGEGKTMEDLAHWGETFEGDLPGSSLGGVAPIHPGGVAYVSLDLTPGNYVALCFVPDPNNHNMPHLAEGMVLPFTIS